MTKIIEEEEIAELLEKGAVDRSIIASDNREYRKMAEKQVTVEDKLTQAIEKMNGLIATAIEALKPKEVVDIEDDDRQLDALNAIATQVGELKGCLQSEQKVESKEVESHEPRKWNFTVERNESGFITGVVAEVPNNAD